MEPKEIEIIDMDLSGRGIGKDCGKAVFLPGTVTGDTVSYETVTSKKRYDIGKPLKIISSSEYRTAAPCGTYEDCGGCSFGHITYGLECRIKTNAIESAFRRSGIRNVSVDRFIQGSRCHYRNKAVFHRDNEGKYGFYSTDHKKIIGGWNCLLVPDVFNNILRYVESVTSSSEIFAPECIMLRSGAEGVMITVQVERFGDSAKLLRLVSDRFNEIVSSYECIGYPTSYDAEFRHSSGARYITTNFAGNTLRISPHSFFQVNSTVAEALCLEIGSNLSPSKDDVILDLYCGIGTIGLTLARVFPATKILGVEINESAVEDAIFNCKASGITNAEFLCSDSGSVSFADISPYAVIVDPPRYGLSDSMINSIIKLDPKILIYMSCDPGTLGGDCSKLFKAGYTIKKCIGADMFPQCSHVETVCVIKKDE